MYINAEMYVCMYVCCKKRILILLRERCGMYVCMYLLVCFISYGMFRCCYFTPRGPLTTISLRDCGDPSYTGSVISRYVCICVCMYVFIQVSHISIVLYVRTTH